MKKVLAIILLTIIALSLSTGLAIADEDIKVKYISNFGGDLQMENWNRIEVEIENQGNSDFTGQVEVDAGGKYLQEIFIEKGKKLAVEFYLPPLGIEHVSQVNVSVKDHRNRNVSTTRVNVSYHYRNAPAHYLGVVSKNPDKFKRIQNVIDTEIVHLKPEHFNNHQFMGNMARIIIDDLDGFTLTQRQKENLDLWIKMGGNLIVGGGRTATENISVIDPKILPYKPERNMERELDNAFFQEKSTVVFTKGEVLGEVQLGNSDFPLLITNNVGKGSIIFSTINFNDSVFNNVVDFEKYMETIITSSLTHYVPSAGSFRLGEAQRLLTLMSVDLGGLKFLSPWFLFIGLLVYILIVGPFNFAFLKKIKKMDYGWLTIPALAIVFTLVLFVIGSMGRSKIMTNTQVNLIEYLNDETAYIESFNNWFIPSSKAKEIKLDFLNVAPTTSGLTSVNNTVLDTSQSRVWSNQRALINTTKKIQKPTVELDLYKNQTVVTITNEFDYEIFESYLWIRGGWYKTGGVNAGETKTLTLRSTPSHIDYQSLFKRLGITSTHWHFQLIDSLAAGGGNYTYIAFDDEFVPIEYKESPTTSVVNINVIHERNMDINIIEPTAIANIKGVVSKISFQNYDTWNLTQYYLSGQGEFELMFQLPRDLTYEGLTGQITMDIYRNNGIMELHIYNNESKEWEIHQASNMVQSISIGDIDDYLNNDVLIIKLVSTDDNSQVDLDLNRITFSVVGGGN